MPSGSEAMAASRSRNLWSSASRTGSLPTSSLASATVGAGGEGTGPLGPAAGSSILGTAASSTLGMADSEILGGSSIGGAPGFCLF